MYVKRQERTVQTQRKKSNKTITEEAQMLDLLVRQFNLAILNKFQKLDYG